MKEHESLKGGPMEKRRLRDLLEALQPPAGKKLWHGGASVLGSLRGVSPEEAAWKPGSDRHTIWELALHIAYWKYAVWRRITGEQKGGFGRGPSNWPAVPTPADARAWDSDRALLRREHERLIEAVATLDPAHLDRKPGGRGKWTHADLILGIVLHDTYHTGQIQMLKRLYAGGR